MHEFRCYEAVHHVKNLYLLKGSKNREKWKGWQLEKVKPRTPQCSATVPQQPDNHQPQQSSTCTAQMVLNASVTHLADTVEGCIRVGGCPAVVAQWQSIGCSSQRCPGFNFRRLPAFSTFCFNSFISSMKNDALSKAIPTWQIITLRQCKMKC